MRECVSVRSSRLGYVGAPIRACSFRACIVISSFRGDDGFANTLSLRREIRDRRLPATTLQQHQSVAKRRTKLAWSEPLAPHHTAAMPERSIACRGWPAANRTIVRSIDREMERCLGYPTNSCRLGRYRGPSPIVAALNHLRQRSHQLDGNWISSSIHARLHPASIHGDRYCCASVLSAMPDATSARVAPPESAEVQCCSPEASALRPSAF